MNDDIYGDLYNSLHQINYDELHMDINYSDI